MFPKSDVYRLRGSSNGMLLPPAGAAAASQELAAAATPLGDGTAVDAAVCTAANGAAANAAASSPPSKADTTAFVQGLMGSLHVAPDLAVKKFIAKINSSILQNATQVCSKTSSPNTKKDISGPPSRLYRGLKQEMWLIMRG